MRGHTRDWPDPWVGVNQTVYEWRVKSPVEAAKPRIPLVLRDRIRLGVGENVGMPLFRRRRRVQMRPFDEAGVISARPTTLEHALEEGMLLADYAARMSVRNAIVTAMLTTETATFDPSAFAAVARDALLRLADESDAAAERMVREHRYASILEGKPEHSHDYRAADSLNLRRREALATATSKELRRRCDDDEYLAELVERSRSDAWREVSREIEHQIDRSQVAPDPVGMGERLDAFRAELRGLVERGEPADRNAGSATP